MIKTDYQYLGVQVEDSVCTLTISNPPANMLSKAVLTELNEFLDALYEDAQGIKAIVITGAGTFFVVGADIKEISEIENAADGTEASSLGQMVFNKLERLPIATIAAVNGHCLGGGCELVLSCTIRIAAERARMGLPEINLGILPGFGGTQRLPRLVGRSKALELMLTGDTIMGTAAAEIGLVSKAVPESDLLKQAQGLAKKIASKPGLSLQRILRLASPDVLSQPQDEGLKLESELFGELCETEDMKEGLGAFLEKRRPKFQNK